VIPQVPVAHADTDTYLLGIGLAFSFVAGLGKGLHGLRKEERLKEAAKHRNASKTVRGSQRATSLASEDCP
jgi:hypothetical protein